MISRLIYFSGGAMLGAVGTIANLWLGFMEIYPWAVGLAALGSGILAAILGAKFFRLE